MCPEHPAHRLKYYCQDDNIGICSQCRNTHTRCSFFTMTLRTEAQIRAEIRQAQPRSSSHRAEGRPAQPRSSSHRERRWKCSSCEALNDQTADTCQVCNVRRYNKRLCQRDTPGFEWTCECGRANDTGRCTGCRRFYQHHD
jgi:hypothetical protein